MNTIEHTAHEIDAAITGLAGNGCDGITADMVADYIAASIVYRVETLRAGDWHLWRDCADEGHADMVATQLRQSPAIAGVRVVAVHLL